MYNRDEGRTWSRAEHLPDGGPIRAKPLVFSKELIVSGSSVESYDSWAAGWSAAPISARRGRASAPWCRRKEASYSPRWGRWLANRFYARSNPMARVCVSDSYDAGVTWSPARATDLPNPNSGIDVAHLKGGRYAMIYNHTPRGRTPLNLAVSADGEHWTPWQTLESDSVEYSYPAMVQAGDGTLQITYKWRRLKIKHVEIKID
jgi:hypothetical protein